MQEGFSFEEIIKEKVLGVRIHPKDDIWHQLHSKLKQNFNPVLNYPILFFLLSIFCFTSLKISKNTSFYFKNRNYYKNQNNIQSINANLQLSNQLSRLGIENTTFEYFLKPISHIKEHESNSQLNEFNSLTEYILLDKPFEESIKNTKASLIHIASKLSVAEESITDLTKQKIINESFREGYAFQKSKVFNSIQVYIAPSISYRLLRASENFISSGHYSSGDSASMNLPTTGLEAGLALWTPINEKWAIKSGVQVNMSRNAGNSSSDMTRVANLKSEKSASSDDINHDKNLAISRNKIMNQNFRFSIPVEVEYKLAGDKALSLFISGSLQPSFSIYSNGNLITSEFKDQMPVDPYLYRRFNVLTGAECFIRLNGGAFDIQVGPQIRYQLLSNNLGASPYKEHLMDYSMKIGIIKKIL
jgi:hypothetical protein